MKEKLIDECAKYIEDKDCHYLAKEGLVVYFFSPTGRKSDFVWSKLTLTEAVRVIKATRLCTESSSELRDVHLITAFQELDRVYEFGIKSRHKVSSGIFNYTEHSTLSMGDSIAVSVCDELQIRGFKGLLVSDVKQLLSSVQEKLGAVVGVKESRELMHKHFEAAGFDIKTGSRRPLIDGKKRPAIMRSGSKPTDVVVLMPTVAQEIVQAVCRELK